MTSLDPRASALVADEGTARSGDVAGSDGGDDRPAVLFVSYTADWRGPTLSLLHLVDHLDQGRYRIAVAHAGGGGFAEALDEREIQRFPFDRLDKWAIPRLAGIVREHDFDLVYANSTHGSSRNAFLAATLARTAFACHVRSMGWEKGWTILGYLWFARAVIAVSDACVESVRRYVRPGRLHRVYNGVPLPAGHEGSGEERAGLGAEEPSELRKEVRAEASDTLLASVSHICRRKGQANAVKAMPSILRRVPGARLCLIGSTDREPDYTRHVRDLSMDLGVDDRVHLLGFRADVPELLRVADLFVHTAEADPHPRAVIEAMYARLPVVAFRVDGVTETVADGRTGRLVEAKNVEEFSAAVAELASNPGLARRMGAAGRQRVEEHFTAQRTAAQVAEIMETVLERRSGSASCRG